MAWSFDALSSDLVPSGCQIQAAVARGMLQTVCPGPPGPMTRDLEGGVSSLSDSMPGVFPLHIP